MQGSKELFIAQPTRHAIVHPGDHLDGRMEWTNQLHRAVRSFLEMFHPSGLVPFASAEPCVMRDLQTIRLLQQAGIITPRHHWSAEQWASLSSMGTGDEATSSSLNGQDINKVSSAIVVSDSALVCHTNKGQTSLQPSIVRRSDPAWDNVFFRTICGGKMTCITRAVEAMIHFHKAGPASWKAGHDVNKQGKLPGPVLDELWKVCMGPDSAPPREAREARGVMFLAPLGQGAHHCLGWQ